jgi:hypothetical protein
VKEILRKKLNKLIQEEQKSGANEELLNKLLDLASGDTLYEKFTPIERNTLNEFFKEVRDCLLTEVLIGNYGSQIIIDAFIVLAFETGYKLKELEK